MREEERRGEGVMSDSDKELENQILEAGEKIIDPPSSLDEFLSPLLILIGCGD
ncbi:hypothetical protein Bca4012_027278 [Brassica carinata]